MSSTPNLEKFSSVAFAREIRAFMCKHELTAREWVSLTGCAFSTLRKMEEGDGNVFVSTIARCQKFIRTYKPSAS